MPWPVYSTRFIAASGADVTRTYTVPSGYRAVITSQVFSNSSTTAAYATVFVANVVLYRHDFQASVGSAAVQLRAVVYGNEQIAVYTSTSGIRAVLSGYLFQETPGTELELQPAQEGEEYPGDLELVLGDAG